MRISHDHDTAKSNLFFYSDWKTTGQSSSDDYSWGLVIGKEFLIRLPEEGFWIKGLLDLRGEFGTVEYKFVIKLVPRDLSQIPCAYRSLANKIAVMWKASLLLPSLRKTRKRFLASQFLKSNSWMLISRFEKMWVSTIKRSKQFWKSLFNSVYMILKHFLSSTNLLKVISPHYCILGF